MVQCQNLNEGHGNVMADFDAIFIDADNTVFDFDRTANQAMIRTLGSYALPHTTESMKHYQSINAACWRLYDEGEIQSNQINPMRWSRWLEVIDHPDKIDAEALAVHYEESLSLQCEVETGAEELMTYLFSKYPVHVITNGLQKVQDHRWRLAGWDDQLHGITVSSVVGVKKPQPEIYQMAMKAVGVTDASRCLMIGDSLQADIEGAQAIGMKACWYQRNGAVNDTDIKPDYIAANLTDIIEHL